MNVKDGILGFAIGDALGVPVEFTKREILEMFPVTEMFGNGVHKQPKGTWSDDTSMILATMDGVIESGFIDYYQIAENFCLWATSKKYNAHDRLFDIGITTHSALRNYIMKDVEPTKAGGTDYFDNGNGSLMRILPMAYYFKENSMSDLEMSRIINDLSSMTHGHELSCLGCYLYTKYAIGLLNGKSFEESYEDLKNVDVSMYSEPSKNAYKRVLNGELATIEDKSLIKSSGFVVDSLEASIWCCLHSKSYEEATLKAVNLGEDTDTVGALAGGLAGIHYGIDNIPKKWLDDLVKKDYIEELSDKYQNTIISMDKGSYLVK